MKIIIENVVFPFDMGCKVLKQKGGNSPFDKLNDIWDDIVPIQFSEIARLENLEQRRVAINYFGIDKIVSEVNPLLVSKKTLKKTTTWITEKGELQTLKFNDTYELYAVSNNSLFGNNTTGQNYYVKCKDTSTDREYLIWVDIESVFLTNNENSYRFEFSLDKINAIQCVAWTIRTNVPKGNIEKIVRQGDCILIKPKDSKLVGEERHLTEQEYRTLLELES